MGLVSVIDLLFRNALLDFSMSEDQDTQKIDALVDAFNNTSFEGMENPKGELNQLYREKTDNSIDLTGNIRDGFVRAYNQDRDTLRDSLIGVIIFSNERLRKKAEKDASQMEETTKKIKDNRALIEMLNVIW